MAHDAESTAQTDLRMAREQVHIYAAILVAAGDAHAVLDIMMDAADADAAHRDLRDRYGFTDVQAWAVLDVQFRRLTSADRHKVEQRLRELTAHVVALEEQVGEA